MPSTNYPNYEHVFTTVLLSEALADDYPSSLVFGDSGGAVVPEAESQSVSGSAAQPSTG